MTVNNNGSNSRHEKRNEMLFWIAAVASCSLVAWFTLAFFREALKMHDVSIGIMSIGLAIIGSYAGHNNFVKIRCYGENGKNKPGEWIFALIICWGFLMWSLYQTNALFYWKDIELLVPEQFYEFLVAIVAIFGGTRIWDVVSSTRKNKPNGPEGGPEAPNPPA